MEKYILKLSVSVIGFATLFLGFSSCQLIATRSGDYGDYGDHGDRAIASNSIEKSAKKYYKAISKEERQEALERAQVFSPEFSMDAIEKTDIIDDFVKPICDSEFKFREGSKINWPKISCDYVPDTENTLSGNSPKFLCAVPNQKGGTSIRKIKYSLKNFFKFKGEVAETLVASNLSKLIGFFTNDYCPMQLTCKGCPSSDPWSSAHSSAPIKQGAEEKFDFAVSAENIDAHTIAESSTKKAPGGLAWSELKSVKANSNEEKNRLLIEREAWMLWINFIQHTDTHMNNQRLACAQSEAGGDGKPYCQKPIMYSHDWGFSFSNHMNYDSWKSHPTFQKSANPSDCIGILSVKNGLEQSAGRGLIVDARFSEEARSLLVERLEKVTDEQLKTIFLLAKVKEISGHSADEWIAVLRRKVDELKSVRCLNFSEGRSVLAN